MEERLRLLKTVTKPLAYEILDSLLESPKRYTDLEIGNDKTKTKRLKELKKLGLIEVKIKEVKERTLLYYNITNKGKRLLEEISKIKI